MMMKIPTEREIQRLRQIYPSGTKIRLIEMDDPYSHLKPGEIGTVMHIDDMGQIHMWWESGSNLALIPDVDRFEIV